MRAEPLLVSKSVYGLWVKGRAHDVIDPSPPLHSHLLSNIVAKTVLTVDTVIIICMSAAMAGIGLAINNRIYIMAGSLLSRLMGPLMGASYGLAILDQELFLTGVRNVTIALLIIISFGALIGVSFAPFADALLWPTDEMATRGVYLEMMFGAIIAICGGASVAIAESNEDLSSVAGIAISSALVPPAVNSGICFSYLLVGDYFSKNEVDTGLFFRIATSSLGIVVMNSFFIYATAWVVFKTRAGGSRFIFKKRDDSHDQFKKLERKMKDSILLGSAKMSDSPTQFRKR
jgi:hypothetical protein